MSNETDMKSFNQAVIDEFRANGGIVGGLFEGAPMLLLTTNGARTGRRLTAPLVYAKDGERLLVFASKGGAPTNPDWYHNLVATPSVTVEVGTEAFEARAIVLTGDERDRLYAEQAERMPNFATYQENTTRVIPVIALERVPRA